MRTGSGWGSRCCRARTATAGSAGGEGARKESSVANQSIRVNVDTLENLMTMVSELVLTRNQLMEMVRRLNDSEFKMPLHRLSNVTGELQEAVMKTRMQPIGNAWQKLPRIVRDLGHELDKKIEQEEEFIRELFTRGETQLGRVFVQEPVLTSAQAAHVLDYERASEIISTATPWLRSSTSCSWMYSAAPMSTPRVGWAASSTSRLTSSSDIPRAFAVSAT